MLFFRLGLLSQTCTGLENASYILGRSGHGRDGCYASPIGPSTLVARYLGSLMVIVGW